MNIMDYSPSPRHLPPPGTYEQFRGKIKRRPPAVRRFLLTLWHAVYDWPGPETGTRQKVMEALQIKRSEYYRLLKNVDTTPSKSPISGGR